MDKQYKVETYCYELNDLLEGLDDSTPTDLSDYFINDIIQKQNNCIKKVVDLSIQAYPGTEFKINNNSNPIIIGPSGIFQWKVLNNEGYIYSIVFKKLPYEMNINELQQINMLVTYGYYEE